MDVLSTETIEVMSGWGILFAVIGIIIAGLGFVTIVVAEDFGSVVGALVGLAMIVGGIVFTVSLNDVGETTYEQYKVTIEDFNEVHDQGYEIVDQEGDIYTIRKRGAGE